MKYERVNKLIIKGPRGWELFFIGERLVSDAKDEAGKRGI